MGAIRMLAANDLRRRWLSTLAITLLIGIVGAIVMAAVAGARRSEASLRHFNEQSRAADLEVDTGKASAEQLRTFHAAVRSAGVGTLRVFGMTSPQRPNIGFATPVDGTFGSVVDRSRLVAGRQADSRAADEATVSEAFAQQTGLGVGSVVDTVSLTPEQVARGSFDPQLGPKVRLHVVGIVRRPGDLSDLAAAGGYVVLTPAFDRVYRDRIAYFTYALRVNVPDRSRRDVIRDAQDAFGKNDGFLLIDSRVENNGGQSAIDVLTAALWIFAAVAAAAGLFAIGIVVVRQISRGRPEQPVLRAMGLSRRDRVVVAGAPALFMVAAGVLVAMVGAIALSPLLPFGAARRADPDVGVHVDWFALALGAVAIAIVVLGAACFAAVRATRVETDRARAAQRRSIAEALGISRLHPTLANGTQMALDPGRDERAVPLRSAFVGAVLGVVGVTAVLVFAASLDNLADTPRLYGWTWDVKVRDASDTPTRCNTDTAGIENVPGVTDLAAVCYQTGLVDGRDTTVWGFTDARGSIAPTAVAGRAPGSADEVALGADVMNALDKHIGDSVQIGVGKPPRLFRIVGRVVFPPMSDSEVQHLADGATMTGAGFASVHKDDEDTSGATSRYVVARLAPGATASEFRQRVLAIPKFHELAAAHPEIVQDALRGPVPPPEIDRVRHAAWFAPVLAVLMSALALIAVAHALITATRRRRHDLAILKAIGFDRHQVRATIAWEATTLAVVGLVFGIPLGIIAGRLAWAVVAHNLGIATTIALPVLALVVLVPLTLLLVNAVAYLPARAASRTRTSVALAAE